MKSERNVNRRGIAKDRRLNVGQQSIATAEPLVSAMKESDRTELLEKAISRIRRKDVKQEDARERKKSSGLS